MQKPVDIIIPTWNNEEFLNPCIESIVRTGILADMADLIIVNNGKQDIHRRYGHLKQIRILEPGENRGWEGGLKMGLENSTAPFVVFQNDDTFIPPNGIFFYHRLLSFFRNTAIAAVAPVTTCASGKQSIYHPGCPRMPSVNPYLIFYTVMLKRSCIDDAGGIDDTLPGGDDFDLSIRLRNLGYKLVIDPGSFIIHHGFKTGTRVKGDWTTKGGWNSLEMIAETGRALIRKHGFKTWWNTLYGSPSVNNEGVEEQKKSQGGDLEGDLIRSLLNGAANGLYVEGSSNNENGKHRNGEYRIAEFGCGAKKTVDHAVGVDKIEKGGDIPHLYGQSSVADIKADVENDNPFPDGSQDVIIARHILEHCIDTIHVLSRWKRQLKIGGKLIIACPDENLQKTVPLNPEHVHGFNEQSLESIMDVLGFKKIMSQNSGNGVSFVGCYERMN